MDRKNTGSNLSGLLFRPSRRFLTSTGLFLVLFLTVNLFQPVSITLAEDGLSSGSSARVANTDGDKLRMRDNPSSTSNTIATIDENEVVTIKGGPFKDKQGNTFYKISFNGTSGYAMAQYLISAGKTSSNVKPLPVGSPVKISNTGGDGVNLRQQASGSGSVLAVLPEGTLLTVMGGPFGDKQGNQFFRVDYKGQTGYITVAYIVAAPRDSVTSGGGGFMKVTNTDGDPIRLRTGPGRTFNSTGFVYEGQVVKVLGSAVKDDAGVKWYRIEKSGEIGFVDASYVARTDAPSQAAPAPAPVPAQAVAPPPKAPNLQAPPSNGTLGSRIVAYAKQYLGWRYVWGGHSPDAGGFDCSGFVHWVLGQNGISTGYSSVADMEIGSPVPLNAIQPGDVLIWSNTYMPGPSHSGIYIGGGRFIHAENYSSGVTISDMSDEYYASRLTAARRP